MVRGESPRRGRSYPIETLRPSHSPGEASITPGARLVNAYDFMTAELLAALIAVESGGNDLARGRHGELGALQVRPCVVKDVNRVVGGNYRWSEMTNRVTATRVARAYLDYWGSSSRLGRKPTDRDLAMIWHHGPTGWRRGSITYWKRVRARMGAS